MNTLKKLLLLICVLTPLASVESFSQNQSKKVTVTGVVTDQVAKEPIPGAAVWLKDSSTGTITDLDGKFSIQVSGVGGVLQVSCLGYETAELEIRGRSNLNFVLAPDSQMMEETVVVGYSTQRRESIVGAIDAISGSDLKLPVANLSSALQGQLAGVETVQRSGEPGTEARVWIRGLSSFNPNSDSDVWSLNSPLILVDGIERSMDLVDPEDVESVSVLKDASATAIYGVRGANGVIIIKTKEGNTGTTKISFKNETGIISPTQMPQMVNSLEFASLYNEAYSYRHDGQGYYSEEMIRKYADGSDPDLYPDVNWIDEMFKDYTTNNRTNINISGGGSIARYFISGSYYHEGSIFEVDNIKAYDTAIKYNKFNFRSNVDINVTPSTIVNVNLSNIYEDKTNPGASGIWDRAFYTSPNAYPLYYSDGTLSAREGDDGLNPYNILTQSGYRQQYWNNSQSLLGITQDFSEIITEGLKANLKVSWDQVSWQSDTYLGTPNTFFAEGRDDDGNLIFKEIAQGTTTLAYSTSATASRTFYLEGTVNYNREFAGKHRVGALFNYNMRSKKYTLASDKNNSLPYRNQGIAGRVTYSYADRYFGEFNCGYNGSENFSPGHRFGFFPSVAGGWMVSNEPFFEPVTNVIDQLKLKVSYGEVGNDQIGASRRFIYENVFATGQDINYRFGSSANLAYATFLKELGNDNVGWERSRKLNLGLEISFFRSLKLQADYFQEHRDGIFLHRDDISSIFGMESLPYANVGESLSRGVDLSADFHKKIGNVQIGFKGNFEFARSYVLNDAKPAWNYAYKEEKWRPINQQKGLIAEGLFASQEEIDNSPVQQWGSVRIGDIKYRDLNGDGVVNSDDITSIGRSNIPEINYSFGPNFRWKNIDFSMLFTGVSNVTFMLSGRAIYPFYSEKLYISGFYKYVYDNCWRLSNQDPSAEFPRNDTVANTNNYNPSSTFWQRDGSYLRLKNATLGYTLPQKWTRKAHMEGARIYVSGVNLLTFSEFKMWDPELAGGQGATYPPNRTISFGININFN